MLTEADSGGMDRAGWLTKHQVKQCSYQCVEVPSPFESDEFRAYSNCAQRLALIGLASRRALYRRGPEGAQRQEAPTQVKSAESPVLEASS